MRILSINPCGASKVILHVVKSYNVGPSRFTSHPRGWCAADFYRPSKSIVLAWFEPATFGCSGKHNNHHYTTKATEVTRRQPMFQMKRRNSLLLLLLLSLLSFLVTGFISSLVLFLLSQW
jgi:hypothetical protein